MNTKKSIEDLEAYFNEELNHPNVINREIKNALLSFAPILAHPKEMTIEKLEKIGVALERLSEIIDIVDR